eukprot:1753526-Prymnesium_polylepis.1
MIGVDVGFDNPVFAAIEVDMEEVENDQETGEVRRAPHTDPAWCSRRVATASDGGERACAPQAASRPFALPRWALRDGRAAPPAIAC